MSSTHNRCFLEQTSGSFWWSVLRRSRHYKCLQWESCQTLLRQVRPSGTVLRRVPLLLLHHGDAHHPRTVPVSGRGGGREGGSPNTAGCLLVSAGTTNVQHFRPRPGEPQPTTASPALSPSHPSTHAELTFNECVSEVYSGLLRHPLTPAQSSLEVQIRGYKRPFVPTMHSLIKASTAYKCSPRRKTRRMRRGTEGCKRNMGSTSATARRPQCRKEPPPKSFRSTTGSIKIPRGNDSRDFLARNGLLGKVSLFSSMNED